MRRIHTLVAAALTVIVLLHALCGSFLLSAPAAVPWSSCPGWQRLC